jgi:hypothetical protein
MSAFPPISGEADSNLCWVEIPVVTDLHRRYDACRLQKWIEAARLLWRDQLDIKAHTAPALKVGLDNLPVLRPTRDLQAARMHPIERLPSFFRERGAGCERYFSDDPVVALILLRQFGEVLAQMLAARSGLLTDARELQAE